MSSVRTPAGEVSLIVDGNDSARTIVLAPGAGADMRHEFMHFFATGLADRGSRVIRFNFAYSQQGRRAPDRPSVLEDVYRAVVEHVRMALDPSSLIVGGKSMGGRIASHLAATGEPVDGLVFLGYPLHPPGRPERIRDAHLYEIEAPMLFVEGTRDPFCPLPTLDRVRSKLKARSEVFVVEDGDHSFKVRKSSGRSTREAWAEAVGAIDDWMVARGAH